MRSSHDLNIDTGMLQVGSSSLSLWTVDSITLFVQGFASSLNAYERSLFNRVTTDRGLAGLRNNLGINFGSSEESRLVPWSNPPTNAAEWNKVCSVICAYRLRDVVAMLDGADSAENIEQRSLDHVNVNFRVCQLNYFFNSVSTLLRAWISLLTGQRSCSNSKKQCKNQGQKLGLMQTIMSVRH